MFSPKPRIICLKFLPFRRCHGVIPSLPRHLELMIMLTCSSNHGVRAWFIGMYFCSRASKHSFSVRNIPRTSRIPTSTPPFDWES